jgi:hypothetical protein
VEDVQAVAAELLRTDRLSMTLIGPYADSSAFDSLLQFR